MKKSIALLCMLACILGLTACGNSSADESKGFCTEEEAIAMGEQTVEGVVMLVSQGAQEMYADDPVITAGLESWEKALEEVGGYNGIIERNATIDKDSATVEILISGSSHNAIMEIIVNADGFESITTNVQYTFGEMMTKAGLNTLVGMGTVFVVLILISFIISAFGLIPKIQESMSKKKESAKDIKAEAIDNTIAQIVQKEELSDDLELVAVIAAAIAASEGAASTDGYVVRSIRKRA